MTKKILLSKSSEVIVRLAIGPNQANQVINQVNHWLQHSGVEWTVGRLKALRTVALQLRASLSRSKELPAKGSDKYQLIIGIYQNNSIAYRKNDLLPRGPFRPIIEAFVYSSRPVVVKRMDSVLRLYTGFILSEVSAAQKRKAYKAITRKSPSFNEEEMCKYIQLGWQHLKSTSLRHSRYLGADGTLIVGGPSLRDLHPFTSCYRAPGVKFSKELLASPYGKFVASLVTTTAWPKAFGREEEPGMFPSDIFEFVRSLVFAPNTENIGVGKIMGLQDKGAKLRSAVQMTALLQWAFSALHKSLGGILQEATPWSCVFAQDRGGHYIIRHLSGKQVVYSIDLSSATDRFPLSLQTYFLRMVGAGSWADALEEICAEPYYTEITAKPTYWHFGAGQPMGLYGSFPLFTLTYICFALGIYQARAELLDGETPSTIEFEDVLRDVGDDLVVKGYYFGKYLASQFEKLGVEVSPTKSLSSYRLAEFAGFVAGVSDHGAFAYRPLVHHPRKCFRNPMSVLDSLGVRVIRLDRGKSTYWHRQYERFSASLRYRNLDLSPTFQTSEDDVSSDGYIDTTRLEQLILRASQEAGLVKDYWTGESYSLSRVTDLCLLLLNEQSDVSEPTTVERTDLHSRVKDCTGRTPINRDPLPEVDRADSPWETRRTLANDPFQSGSYDDLLDVIEKLKAFEKPAVEQKPCGSGHEASPEFAIPESRSTNDERCSGPQEAHSAPPGLSIF